MSGTELYIYYSVATARQGDVRAALAAFCARLAAIGRPLPRLLQRDEPDTEGALTWMEIHGQLEVGDEERIEEAARESGLCALVEGLRHVERFRALTPPCA